MFWSGRTYLSQPIEGFIAGNHDFMAVCQPLSLLRDAVMDVWIAPYPDCPDKDDPEIASFPLCRFPCILVLSESHPLFSIQKELTIDDIAAYPSLSCLIGYSRSLRHMLEALVFGTLHPVFFDIRRRCGRAKRKMN